MNNKAVRRYLKHQINIHQLIQSIDSAIAVDSNCDLVWQNKCQFQLNLQQFDNALFSAKKIAGIKRSHLHDELIGIIFYKLGNNDSAQAYFKTALQYYDAVLDTMNRQNKFYKNTVGNKAMALKLADRNKEGDSVLEVLYENETVDWMKESFKSTMQTSKKEFLDHLYKDKQDEYGVIDTSEQQQQRLPHTAPHQ
jgi:tetratricopeptide (TPR) repeat protein